jgi:hypothetical protein
MHFDMHWRAQGIFEKIEKTVSGPPQDATSEALIEVEKPDPSNQVGCEDED